MLDSYFINLENKQDFTHKKYTCMTTILISCLNLLYGIIFFSGYKVFYPEIIYNLVGTLFYCFHSLGHITIRSPYFNWWYKQHRRTHHLKHYPPSKFINTSIKRTYNEPDLLEISSYIGLVIIGVFYTKAIISIDSNDFLKLCFFSALHMLITDYFHSTFHKVNILNIKPNILKHIYFLHYIHHKNNCKIIYCIVDFRFDLMYGTYSNDVKTTIGKYH